MSDFGKSRVAPEHGSWLKQYRLEYNWSRGRCSAKQISLETTERSRGIPLAAVQNDRVFCVGQDGMLDVHTKRGELVGRWYLNLGSDFGRLSAIVASECSDKHQDDCSTTTIYIGSEAGKLASVRWSKTVGATVEQVIDATATSIRSLSRAGDIVCTVSRPATVSVHHVYKGSFRTVYQCSAAGSELALTSVHARVRGRETHVSIACLRPVLAGGKWCPYVQELRFLDGRLVGAPRSASADEPADTRCPSRVRYRHPYFITASTSNTLHLHIVRSRRDALEIVPAGALWGHSAAVTDVDVRRDGRAISVSRGDIRAWDLGRGRQSCRIEAVNGLAVDDPAGIVRLDHSSVVLGALLHHVPVLAIYDFSPH